MSSVLRPPSSVLRPPSSVLRPPSSVLRFSWLVCAAASFPSQAQAACSWAASLDLGAHADHPSGAFEATWSTASNCGSFTLDHYRVVINDTATPTSISDGEFWNVAAGTTTVSAFVHRSERVFYGKVYACDTSTCVDVYGNGAGETVTTDTDTGTTEQEEWVLTGVTGPTDTAHYVTNVTNALAASAFFYPGGWSRANQLALYYSVGDSIYMQYTESGSSGWQNYNDTTIWEAAVLVAEGHESDTDFDEPSHAYVSPVVVGGNNRVRMLAQNAGSVNQVVSIDSTDDEGDDFNLTCADCCDGNTAGECDWPTVADVAICSDMTSSCDYLERAQHGRWVWDYIADGVPDLSSDTPSVVFSGQYDESTCTSPNGPTQAEIFWADWDTANAEWDVSMSGGCPVIQYENRHDPGIQVFPGGLVKMYVMQAEGNGAEFHLYYFDGFSWESQSATPVIYLDDGGTTEVEDDCLSNPAGIVRFEGGPQTGLFLDIQGVGGDCASGVANYGIYFAELSN